jgi:hypothetical protein
LLGTLQNFNHATFWATFAIKANYARFDTIAVQYRAHLIRRQKDIWRTIVSLHKAMPVAVPRNGSFKLFQ